MAQAAAPPENRGFVNKMLDTIEKVGNKVPSPVMMFLYLIIGVIVLSAILDIANVTITEEIIVAPLNRSSSISQARRQDQRCIRLPTTPSKVISLLTRSGSTTLRSRTSPCPSEVWSVSTGARFIFTSFVSNFAGFSVVAVIFVSMIGIGVAEHAGLMDALIRSWWVLRPVAS